MTNSMTRHSFAPEEPCPPQTEVAYDGLSAIGDAIGDALGSMEWEIKHALHEIANSNKDIASALCEVATAIRETGKRPRR